MTDDLNNIDKLFKTAIDGHEEEPSPASWEAIDKRLDNSNIVSIRKKYANLKKWVVVLLLLLFGGVVYELHSAFSHNAITANTGTSKTNNYAINNRTTQNTKQNSVTSSESINSASSKSNNNIVVTINDEKDNNVSASQSTSASKNIKTTSYIKDKTKPGHHAAHNFIEVHTKAKVSSRITNGEVSELDDVTDTKASSDNKPAEDKLASGFHQAILLKALPVQAVTHPDAASLIQRAKLPNNILSKNSISNFVSAPNKKGIMAKPFRFSLTLFYSPSLPSDLIEDDDDDNNRNNNNGEDAAHIKRGEHQSSYSLGASIEYNINRRWSIQSGLTFIQKVSRINPKTVYAADAGNGNIGYLFDFSSGYSYLPSKSNLVVGDSAQTSRSTNTLQYLAIPLQAKYTITKGKFSFNASLGMAYNVLLKGTLETEVANDTTIVNETVNRISGLKNGYVSGLIGFGAEYPLTRKIAVCFNPSFDMAFTSITQGAPVKSYPSFFAFATGLHFKL
jgi:hypothetical protein